MKIIIKSKQDYKTYTEEYTEEFECSVEENDNIITINFENGSIQIEENKIIYERNENKIIIEAGKTIPCDYETQYGMFVLDIKGLEVNKLVENVISIENSNEIMVIANSKYEIQMVGIESYENQIEISISK